MRDLKIAKNILRHFAEGTDAERSEVKDAIQKAEGIKDQADTENARTAALRMIGYQLVEMNYQARLALIVECAKLAHHFNIRNEMRAAHEVGTIKKETWETIMENVVKSHAEIFGPRDEDMEGN